MKKILLYLCLAIIGVLLLIALVWQQNLWTAAGTGFPPDLSAYTLHHMLMSVLLVLMGFLIYWDRVKRIIARQISIDIPLLVIALALTVISFLSPLEWIKWFGITRNLFPLVLQTPLTSHLLSLLAGVLLISALTANKRNSFAE